MRTISRRRMFQVLGAGGVWTLVGCGKHSGPSAVDLLPEGWNRGEERWVASTCLQCPGGCGIRVRVYEGRAVKIEGIPDHPLNRGGLCPKGQAGLQALYDPDRITGPMKKVGGRSSNKWVPISWEEAIDTVASKLGEIRKAGKPHSLLLCGGRFPGHMRELFERLARAYGTPNLVDSEPLGKRAARLGMLYQQGVADLPAIDLERTRYLMVFGANFLEAWQPTTYTLRAYGAMRRGQVDHRAKIVVVDPRCGVSASKADEWLPIRPGTDAALALGLAHVIVKDGLFDRAFVDQHTFGFEDYADPADHDAFGVAARLKQGFRNMVLRDYPPDRVEAITGVQAGVIERLAREITRVRPAVAVAGRGVGARPNGLFTHMAINSLNALLGSIDVPGGVLVQERPGFNPWPEVAFDAAARTGLAQPPLTSSGTFREDLNNRSNQAETLLDSLYHRIPYPIEAALVYYTNPLFSNPDTARHQDAFDRIPFVATFSPFMDETTARADLVLPDGTYLERLEDNFIQPSVGFAVLGLRQPVVKPVHDVRHTGDVMLEISRRIGGTVAQSFPWNTYEEALKEAASGLLALPGSFTADTADEFWEQLKTRGFWLGGPYRYQDWNRVLRTPTGKFEFFSTVWERQMDQWAAERQAGQAPDAPLARAPAAGYSMAMARFAPASLKENSKGAPFLLLTYKTMMHAEGRGANQPWLQQSFGVQLSERWEPWVEINPVAAESLGIRDRDPVWVESERGRLKMCARLHPGLGPDVVSIPFEYGHTAYGRWANGGTGNPNEIMFDVVDPATGVRSIFATRVKVYPARNGAVRPRTEGLS